MTWEIVLALAVVAIGIAYFFHRFGHRNRSTDGFDRDVVREGYNRPDPYEETRERLRQQVWPS